MEKYKTGLLMGVFDLFHVGHLKLIIRAKALSEYLRVAILSDQLVKQYKGHFPIINEQERQEILEHIKEVDEVVIIEDNPSRIMEWHRRHFDCFFSGNDYNNNDYWKWEKEELRKLGSDMIFFPYTESQSTTKIITRIREMEKEE